MKTNLFCPNCFQSDCFNGRLCYQCGYEQKAAVDSRAMRAGVLLKTDIFWGVYWELADLELPIWHLTVDSDSGVQSKNIFLLNGRCVWQEPIRLSQTAS